ncbi:MAG TPA: DUF4010 domain-containing protein [Candidatus Limnocylindria bacterium]|nr:DUF4010 domain-containing protein [Candidatus Limnocylindria bacterium]
MLEHVPAEARGAVAILTAALGGLAVGIERQWSGHATGPRAHLGGIRTFALLGAFAGAAGWLSVSGLQSLALVLLAAMAALVVVSYRATSRREIDATTEVAAFVVLAAGVMAGRGELALASGIIAVTCLLLVEKSRLHGLVARIDDVSIRAGARFAVMAVVVLPLLPAGPYGPWGGVRPRALWGLVLLFAGLSFLAYVARRAVGAHRGYTVAGLLGGLVSSTSATLTFARESRERHGADAALATGALAACTTMYGRMLGTTLLLAPPLFTAAWPALVVPAVTGAGLLALARRQTRPRGDAPAGPRHPLALGAALQMALLFQLVLFVVEALRTWIGRPGVLFSGAVLGFTDVDALVVAMANGVATGIEPATAAQAVAFGALANTVLKLGIVVAVGKHGFRGTAAAYLAVLGAATAAGVALVVLLD